MARAIRDNDLENLLLKKLNGLDIDHWRQTYRNDLSGNDYAALIGPYMVILKGRRRTLGSEGYRTIAYPEAFHMIVYEASPTIGLSTFFGTHSEDAREEIGRAS